MNTRRMLGAALACGVIASACGDGEEQGTHGGGAGGTQATGGAAGAAGEPIDPLDFVKIEKSCAYNCPLKNCSEQTTPYACQNSGDWATIPHAEACGTWAGTYPTPATGKCSATTPAGDAVKYAGKDPDDATRTVLPDGRYVTPAGKDWVFAEDIPAGITTGVIAVPNSTFLATVDTGPGDHVVRLVDTTLMGSGDPVVSYVKFDKDISLDSGIAFVAPDLIFAPSANGMVYAMKVDVAAKTLARDDTRDITLPPVVASKNQPNGWYASSAATSPDGKRMVVSSVFEPTLLVYDVESGSSTFGSLIGQVDLPDKQAFGAYFDPADTSGTRVYVSLWAAAKLVEVDLADPTQPAVLHVYDTGKNPQGVAFLDTRWVVVGSDLGDTLHVVDRTTFNVTEMDVDASESVYGIEPSNLAYDPAAKRLYATLSGINAVAAYDVDLAPTPPKITPAGRLPTAWWPSGVVVLPAGDLGIVSMRARGTGPSSTHFDIGDGDITSLIRGGVQLVPFPDSAALSAGEKAVAANNAVGERAGRPTVSCPGSENDFPVPETNTAPSKQIKHVFFVVKENKNFDALFGDLEGVEGDASLTLKTDPAEMEKIWPNLRTLARGFTLSDNYYTAAVQSTQGHVWTTHGRTTDFNERTWAVSGAGHDARLIPGGGVLNVGRPVEGSLFDWLGKNDVVYDMFGEIVGSPQTVPAHNPIDAKYPGGPFQNIGYNDLEKACYVAGRARVLCNLNSFSYITLPNDHTFGVSPSNPSPETFCSINDEAAGMLVDALSHSPLWESSLIVITQDDPLDGAEHIDHHRTPLTLISPWVKRGYVSKTHIDTAGIHKLFAHLLGKPYPNVMVEHAALPLDAFTSTPDYTPYTYQPHKWPIACGGGASAAEALLTESWDFSEPDEQPGLGAQVARWMRGKQIQRLTPDHERRVRARIFALAKERAEEAREAAERAASPGPALPDDDDD